jgi:2-methylcitrate dehydratase
VVNAVSNAWIDGGALRTYRHAPNTGSRKSWAAGDATSRAVRHGLMALKGEMGYPSALSAKTWGFYDVLFKGQPFKFQRPYGSYVMENVLIKISYPAEFHAQTAVEAAMALHAKVKDKLGDIEKIVIETQEPGVRIIDKTGELANPADRDHCIQYMVAIPLIFGRLTAADYEDAIARDPRVDRLRSKMEVKENKKFTQDYYDPAKRYIGNAIQVFFKGGTKSERVEVEFPIGHRKRRAEGIPVLVNKFEKAIAGKLSARQCAAINSLCGDQKKLEAASVTDFMSLWAV